MKVGVTGTRNEITRKQFDALVDLILKLDEAFPALEFHHGDCVGADDTAARLFKLRGIKIVCHPPVKEDL